MHCTTGLQILSQNTHTNPCIHKVGFLPAEKRIPFIDMFASGLLEVVEKSIFELYHIAPPQWRVN